MDNGAIMNDWEANRLIHWIRSDARPANIAFTAGPERQVAYVVEELKHKIKDMTEALEFYADKRNYDQINIQHPMKPMGVVMCQMPKIGYTDRGLVARKVLGWEIDETNKSNRESVQEATGETGYQEEITTSEP
jgi:hypothetical protein